MQEVIGGRLQIMASCQTLKQLLDTNGIGTGDGRRFFLRIQRGTSWNDHYVSRRYLESATFKKVLDYVVIAINNDYTIPGLARAVLIVVKESEE